MISRQISIWSCDYKKGVDVNRFFILFVASLIVGCAGGTRWAHPNYSEEKFQIDESRCSLYSRMMVQQKQAQILQVDPRMTPHEKAAVSAQNAGSHLGAGLSNAIEQTSIYRDCLRSLGYFRQ